MPPVVGRKPLYRCLPATGRLTPATTTYLNKINQLGSARRVSSSQPGPQGGKR